MIQFLLCAMAVLVGCFVAYLALCLLFISIRIAIESAVRKVRVVQGTSMHPEVTEGSLIIMWKAKKKRIRHGKIVYVPKFGIPRKDGIVDHLLRIIGMPGDVVELNGRAVFLNGRVLDEPYIIPPTEDYEYQRWVVHEDEYFVLGDNRPEADDSRHNGPIPKWNVSDVMLCDITELPKSKKTRIVFRSLERFCQNIERGNHYL